MEPEIFALQQEVERLTQRLEQSKKLYEMTLDNEQRWMKKWETAAASIAAKDAEVERLKAELGDQKELTQRCRTVPRKTRYWLR